MRPAGGAVVALPTNRDEAWRYTPVDEIVARMEAATAATARASSTSLSRRLVDSLAGAHGGPRLVFVNGTYDAELSDHDLLSAGLWCGATNLTDVEAAWNLTAPADDDGFVARNRATGSSVAVVAVYPAAQIHEPVHIVHVASPESVVVHGRGMISHPRTVIDVGDGAHVAVIETYCGLDGSTVTNASTTIHAGSGADVDHCRIQTESSAAVHVGHTRIEQAEGARLRLIAVTVGGDIARNEIAVNLAGSGADTSLAGLHVTTGRQRHDTVVTVDHLAPRCASTQRFTGVVNDYGRGSFSGEIIVRPGAEATDANQMCRNLILSANAEADTRPWLRILADDVRCSHGATVGGLDDDALFYLRSRGIPLTVARTMLIEAFVRDITDRIPHETLRDQVSALVAASGGIERTETEESP